MKENQDVLDTLSQKEHTEILKITKFGVYAVEKSAYSRYNGLAYNTRKHLQSSLLGHPDALSDRRNQGSFMTYSYQKNRSQLQMANNFFCSGSNNTKLGDFVKLGLAL